MARPTKNPFTPTFGASPPLLVGRDVLIDEFSEGLEAGVGAPQRATLFTGVRGVGKTVLLREIENVALNADWLVVPETALPGMLHRIISEHLPALLVQLDGHKSKRQLRAVGVTTPLGGANAEWDTKKSHEVAAGLRTRIGEILRRIGKDHGGLLFTVDEVHKGESEAMRLLGAEIQHGFGNGLNVAFAGAGLPSEVDDLLNAGGATFLRRADRHQLGSVDSDSDLANAIRVPIESTKRSISDPALGMAIDATQGYPFMIQLVGYHAWRQRPHRDEITVSDVEAGILDAFRRLGALIHHPVTESLSEVSRTYLIAMAEFDGPAPTGSIARAMNVTPQYAGVYRRRLIDAGVIRESGYGHVDFVLPGLREYLREHAAMLVSPQRAPK